MQILSNPLLIYDGVTFFAPAISSLSFTGSVLSPFPGGVQVSVTGGSGGTVTSVGLSMPSIFSVTGSPVLGAGVLTATLNTQAANTFFSGPTTGVAAVPTFRTMVAADLTSALPVQTGNAGKFLQTDGFGNLSWQTAGGGGGVGPAVANQVAYFNSASTVTGNADFTFDPSNRGLYLDKRNLGGGSQLMAPIYSYVSSVLRYGVNPTLYGSDFGSIQHSMLLQDNSNTQVTFAAFNSFISIYDYGHSAPNTISVATITVENSFLTYSNISTATLTVKARSSLIQIAESGTSSLNVSTVNTKSAGNAIQSSFAMGDGINMNVANQTGAIGFARGFAWGSGLDVQATHMMVIGTFNTVVSVSEGSAFSQSQPAFVIGNGTSSGSRSDAFKVNYDGSIRTYGSETHFTRISSSASESLSATSDYLLVFDVTGDKTITLPALGLCTEGIEYKITNVAGGGNYTVNVSGGLIHAEIIYSGTSVDTHTVAVGLGGTLYLTLVDKTYSTVFNRVGRWSMKYLP